MWKKICVLVQKLVSRHILLSCFGKVVLWMKAACAQMCWSQDSCREQGVWRYMKTKRETSTCKDHGDHLFFLRTRESLKTLKKSTALLGSIGKQRTQGNHGPQETEKGTQGIELSWSRHSLAEHTIFSSSHGTFSKRDHILGPKTQPNTMKGVDSIRQLLSDLYEIQLEINNRKKPWESPKSWDLKIHFWITQWSMKKFQEKL